MVRQASAALLLCLISSTAALAAEGGTIAPDRPGISSGTHTVAPGTFYLESGFQYSVNRSGTDASNYNLPQLVFRTGVSEGLELDVLWSGWNRDQQQGGFRQTSVSDLSIGGKYRLHQGEMMNLTLFGLASLPVGSVPSTSDSVDPLLGLLFDRSLGGNLQFFANLLANRFESEGQDVIERQVMLGLGYSHGPRLSSFVEYFAAFPNLDGVAETAVIDGGFTFFPQPDLQFDVSVGLGLNDASSHFLSVGLSFRY